VGSYEVNLTVTDDGATNSATRKITVGEVPNVIYVPDGYAKIQWAVDNASAGDTIIVRDGTYYENVVVNKHLSLKSENRSAYTTINGGGRGHVVRITADNVRMEGFTVTGSGWYEYDSGLEITSSNNIITNNSISNNNAHGIYLYSSSNNNIITSNNIYSNSWYGIRLSSSSNNRISSNNISNNDGGIYLDSSSNNSITSNNISNNDYGIGLGSSSNNNIISSNNISNNDYGIGLYSSSNNNNISSNNIYSNNYAGIYLDSSSNNSITSNNISNNYDGIVLNPSSNNSITSNNIYSNNDNGIDLYSSSNNSITSNNIYSNNWHGIALGLSYNNSISSNNIYSNNEEGIALYSSSNNSITSNNIYSNNYDGIWLYSSSNNLIFLNNLINNSYNVDFYSSTNIWNSPSKVTYTYNGSEFENYLGNYWNDYKEKYPDAEEIDGTGIGDTPYSIDGDKDNYPLKERFENYFGSVEDYSALIKCISNETDFYKKSSETTFDSWWWTERADEEMEEAMKVLASSLVGSVAGAELQLALLGTGSKIVKVIGPVGYMMTAYDVVNAISKGLDSRFYSDIGWAIAGDSVLIQGDLNNLVANGNTLTNALKDKNESRIESLLKERAYLIRVAYANLATLDKNAATSLKNPSTTPLYVPSDEYQLIHSHVATLHFQLQRDYSVTISTLNNLTEKDYNPFLHEECPEGKIKPQRLDKGVLGWCYGCLDHTGDSDEFNIRVPSESDTLCVVNTYGLHEISPANITLKLEQDGELIKQSNDKLIIESPEEGTYNLYVESRNGSQVYGFCTHIDLCGGWKILPTDIQPAWEAYPVYPDPIIIDYLTNPIKVDKDRVSIEEEINVSVNASNEGGESAWQSIAISSPDINNTESYTILDSNLDYCEKYDIGYDTGYNYGNTTKPLKYPLIEGAKNNWDKEFTGMVKLKIKPEKEGILRIYAKSVAYGSGVWRSAPKIFETPTKDQQNEYAYVKSIVVTNRESDETEIVINCPVNATNEISDADMSITNHTKIFYLPAELNMERNCNRIYRCQWKKLLRLDTSNKIVARIKEVKTN
jgi:parallel beta-helix repeat protein